MKKLVYIQISIATIFIVSLLSSCESQRAANKIEWLKKRGYLITDTLKIKGEKIKGEKELYLDSAKLDSVAQVLSDHYQALLDSCANSKDTSNARKSDNLAKNRKEKIKELIKQIPCKISPLDTSSKRYELKIWVEGGNLNYDLKIKDIEQEILCPKCSEPKWYDRFWIGFVCGIGLMFGILYLVNRKNYVK